MPSADTDIASAARRVVLPGGMYAVPDWTMADADEWWTIYLSDDTLLTTGVHKDRILHAVSLANAENVDAGHS